MPQFRLFADLLQGKHSWGDGSVLSKATLLLPERSERGDVVKQTDHGKYLAGTKLPSKHAYSEPACSLILGTRTSSKRLLPSLYRYLKATFLALFTVGVPKIGH